jgi:hypothetical protein
MWLMPWQYSDDMGEARTTSCSNDTVHPDFWAATPVVSNEEQYRQAGFMSKDDRKGNDPAADFLPLVLQESDALGQVNTTVLEQPLDFTTLADKYSAFATVRYPDVQVYAITSWSSCRTSSERTRTVHSSCTFLSGECQ